MAKKYKVMIIEVNKSMQRDVLVKIKFSIKNKKEKVHEIS